MYGMKLSIHFQSSTGQPLKFGNGYVIAYHTYFIHVGINVYPW